jgi:hypothetical protein
VQTKLLGYEAARGECAETGKGVAALLYMAFALWIAVYALGSLGSGMMSYGTRGILFIMIPGCMFLFLFVQARAWRWTAVTANEFVCAAMAVFILINFFSYRNKTSEVVIMIAGFAFMAILTRIRGWQGISLNVIRWYAYAHIALGYFLWFNPDIISGKLIYLYGLSESGFATCSRMIERGYMMGIHGHYSSMGMILAVALIVVCTKHIFSEGKKPGVLGCSLIGITFLAILLNGKRGILLFTVAAVMITWLRFYRKSNIAALLLKWSVAAIAVLLIVYFVLRDFDIVNQIFVTFERFSFSGHTNLNSLSNHRIGLWTVGWQLFLQNPVFGAGWGGYHDLLVHSVHRDTHNVYLQLLCETGIVGFSIFMLFFVRTLVITYRLIVLYDSEGKGQTFEGKSSEKQYLAFSFCMQIFFLLYCFTENPLYDNLTFIPYIIACAMTYSAYYGHCHTHGDGKGRGGIAVVAKA